MIDLTKEEAAALLCENTKWEKTGCGGCEKRKKCAITIGEHKKKLRCAIDKLKAYIEEARE